MIRLLTALLFASLGASAHAQPENLEPPPAPRAAGAETPDAVIRSWPAAAQSAARAMIEKYGLPHRYDGDALVWNDAAPWSRIVVHRRGRPGADDYLEESILYEVQADQVADLRRFDRRLEVDLKKGELSSRAESESLNFLALNLADEILRGDRTPETARETYRKTARLAKAGKSSAYMAGLQFPGHSFMGKTYYP